MFNVSSAVNYATGRTGQVVEDHVNASCLVEGHLLFYLACPVYDFFSFMIIYNYVIKSLIMLF